MSTYDKSAEAYRQRAEMLNDTRPRMEYDSMRNANADASPEVSPVSRLMQRLESLHKRIDLMAKELEAVLRPEPPAACPVANEKLGPPPGSRVHSDLLACIRMAEDAEARLADMTMRFDL